MEETHPHSVSEGAHTPHYRSDSGARIWEDHTDGGSSVVCTCSTTEDADMIAAALNQNAALVAALELAQARYRSMWIECWAAKKPSTSTREEYDAIKNALALAGKVGG